MTYLAENSRKLSINKVDAFNVDALIEHARNFSGVCLLRLPANKTGEQNKRLKEVGVAIAEVAKVLGSDATLITVGESVDLVDVQSMMPDSVRYQSWIIIKRNGEIDPGPGFLANKHFGVVIHTRYKNSLRHAKTRIAYTFCEACDKTTKDYGGKKHTYHEYGTLLSDVWSDSSIDLSGDISELIDRFADFFGIDTYDELRVIDCQLLFRSRIELKPSIFPDSKSNSTEVSIDVESDLILGDSLEELRRLPSNSIDFAFADPPYNLSKNYTGYSDDLSVTDYFDWCDQWLTELARVLKPGRTCAILNIPLYAIRHFIHLEKILRFQNWITWDALSYPVRLLMPAHYSIVLFSKDSPRSLPGFSPKADIQEVQNFLKPLIPGFCLRSSCLSKRSSFGTDRELLTDLWTDIHRLKHNTRRVDHPCQLPPQLMYRLISLLTQKGEVVLDCFNGAGTTTLTAHQLGRKYMGIEKEESYHQLTKSRHEEIELGIDPFRKAERVLSAKNSPVKRVLKQKYEVSKKTLQLEVRRIAQEIGHVPSRDEVASLTKFPVEYYDNYFVSWGEVCAAARTTGMSESRTTESNQISLFGK